MTRSAKQMGLTLVAICVVGLTAASAAYGTNHKIAVASAPAIITAEGHESTAIAITSGKQTIRCTSKYEGTASNQLITEATVTPIYSECKLDGSINATVDVNHCAFLLSGETDANEDAPVHLQCAEGSEITITYSLFGSSCVIHVPPQTPKGGVHYTQKENGGTGKQDITVKLTLTGIKYTETGSGFCPATETREDGELAGAATAQAYKDDCESALAGTEKTTPSDHYNICESTVQDLELATT